MGQDGNLVNEISSNKDSRRSGRTNDIDSSNFWSCNTLLNETASFWGVPQHEPLFTSELPTKKNLIKDYILEEYDREMDKINRDHNVYNYKRCKEIEKLDKWKLAYKAIMYWEDPFLMFHVGEIIVKRKHIFGRSSEKYMHFQSSTADVIASMPEIENKSEESTITDSLIYIIKKSMQKSFSQSSTEDDEDTHIDLMTEIHRQDCTTKNFLLFLLKWYRIILAVLGDKSLNPIGDNLLNLPQLKAAIQFRCGCFEWLLECHDRSYHYFKDSRHLIPESALNAFAICFNGVGSLPRNPEEALALIEDSCRDFSLDGRFHYFKGMCNEIGGQFHEKNYRVALECYETAARYNYIPALLHLFNLYLIHDPRRDPRIIQNASSSVFPIVEQLSKSDLADIDIARKQIPFDPVRAFKYLKRCAIQLGDPEAQYMLAMQYLGGQYIKKSTKKAIKLLVQSANQGYKISIHQLSLINYTGFEGTTFKKSYRKALHWAKEGAKSGFVQCEWMLKELQQIINMKNSKYECSVEGIHGLEYALRNDAKNIYYFDKVATRYCDLQIQKPLTHNTNEHIASILKSYAYPLKKMIWCCSFFELGSFQSLNIQRGKLSKVGLWIFNSVSSHTFSEKHLREFFDFVQEIRCKKFRLYLYQMPKNGTAWMVDVIDSYFKAVENNDLEHYSIQVHHQHGISKVKSIVLDLVVLNASRQNIEVKKIKNQG